MDLSHDIMRWVAINFHLRGVFVSFSYLSLCMKLYLDPYLDRVKGEMELKIESSYWKSEMGFC